jgi:hypothetical protein
LRSPVRVASSSHRREFFALCSRSRRPHNGLHLQAETIWARHTYVFGSEREALFLYFHIEGHRERFAVRLFRVRGAYALRSVPLSRITPRGGISKMKSQTATTLRDLMLWMCKEKGGMGWNCTFGTKSLNRSVFSFSWWIMARLRIMKYPWGPEWGRLVRHILLPPDSLK